MFTKTMKIFQKLGRSRGRKVERLRRKEQIHEKWWYLYMKRIITYLLNANGTPFMLSKEFRMVGNKRKEMIWKMNMSIFIGIIMVSC